MRQIRTGSVSEVKIYEKSFADASCSEKQRFLAKWCCPTKDRSLKKCPVSFAGTALRELRTKGIGHFFIAPFFIAKAELS